MTWRLPGSESTEAVTPWVEPHRWGIYGMLGNRSRKRVPGMQITINEAKGIDKHQLSLPTDVFRSRLTDSVTGPQLLTKKNPQAQYYTFIPVCLEHPAPIFYCWVMKQQNILTNCRKTLLPSLERKRTADLQHEDDNLSNGYGATIRTSGKNSVDEDLGKQKLFYRTQNYAITMHLVSYF